MQLLTNTLDYKVSRANNDLLAAIAKIYIKTIKVLKSIDESPLIERYKLILYYCKGVRRRKISGKVYSI